MEVGLTEFGATIAVGVYVLAVASIVWQFIFGFTIPKVQLTNGNSGSTATNAAIAVLVFSVGVLTEDVTDKFKDDYKAEQTKPEKKQSKLTNQKLESNEKQTRFSAAPVIAKLNFLRTKASRSFGTPPPSETNLRLDLLFPELDQSTIKLGKAQNCQLSDSGFAVLSSKIDRPPGNLRKTSNLASDLIKSNIFGRFTNHPTKPLGTKRCSQKNILNMNNDDEEEISDRVNYLYYTAKNIVYQNAMYNRELSKIQSRIDFTRSLMLISPLLFYVVLFSTILCLTIRNFVNVEFFQTASEHVIKRHRNAQTDDNERNLVTLKASVSLLLALWITSIMSFSAYSHEEGEFNKRVYGYFVTLYSLDNDLADTVQDRKIDKKSLTN